MARDFGDQSQSAQWVLEHCFYVDDGLFSCDNEDAAVQLLTDTHD